MVFNTGILSIRFLRNHLSKRGRHYTFLFVSNNMHTVSVEVMLSSNAMPSPMEKGDRGAVDKDYLGVKEK